LSAAYASQGLGLISEMIPSMGRLKSMSAPRPPGELCVRLEAPAFRPWRPV
jgi:hypothetical protein